MTELEQAVKDAREALAEMRKTADAAARAEKALEEARTTHGAAGRKYIDAKKRVFELAGLSTEAERGAFFP